MIKSVLKCMRDARITVSFPKTEIIRTEARAAIANRSLDSFYLVQQCRLFRNLPDELCTRLAQSLTEHSFRKGAIIVRAGERRHSLFIVGEGLARRLIATGDGSAAVVERFIATEAFGRHALFCLDLQVATVTAETDVLIYELGRDAIARLFAEDAALKAVMALAMAQASTAAGPPDSAEQRRQVALYEGRIEACYGLPLQRPANDAKAAG